MNEADPRERLREIVARGWIPFAHHPNSGRGTGRPGKILEELLEIDGGNADTPDTGRWEIKFHANKSPITLFHLEGQPRGYQKCMAHTFGKIKDNGERSFRHTLRCGRRSNRNLIVANENGQLTVRNKSNDDVLWVHWTQDHLINAFVTKLRRLVVVEGEKNEQKGKEEEGSVRFNTPHFFWEPRTTQFMKLIEDGIIAVEFDMKIEPGKPLRNHGTKFRINFKELPGLYIHSRGLD